MPDTVAGYWHDVTLGEVLGHGHQRWELELETKVREDFIITEKALRRPLVEPSPGLKCLFSHLRHY